MSRSALVERFVPRRKIIDRIIEDLPLNAGGSLQHHLLIGHRGMGKSTLLRRLGYAIEDHAALSQHWLPLMFPEEQYNVVHLSDVWLNVLDALYDHLEHAEIFDATGLEALDVQLDAIHDIKDEGTRHDMAYDLILALSHQLSQRLVLLVDNLDQILERLEHVGESWGLREVLSAREARLLLIGTSGTLAPSLWKYDQAFYAFFQTHHLRPLSQKETFAVIRSLAAADGAEQVLRVLDHDPGRVESCHILTGGNPRAVVLVYTHLRHTVDGDVHSDLEQLLDRYTPLYRHSLSAMSPQRQHIVGALCRHWHPARASDVAQMLRLDVNQVSSQLNRLVKEGVVEKVRLHRSKRAGFQLNERLFNVWFLMRSSHRVRRKLLRLIDYLKCLSGTGPDRDQAVLTVEDAVQLLTHHTPASEAPSHQGDDVYSACLDLLQGIEADHALEVSKTAHAILRHLQISNTGQGV